MSRSRQLLSINEGEGDPSKRKSSLLLYGSVILLLISVIILIVGIILISRREVKCEEPVTAKIGETSKLRTMDQYCAYSDEAKRMNLPGILKKVQKSYYAHYPNQIAYQPDMTAEELNSDMRERFFPYDPRPEILKAKTDAALALLDEVNTIPYDRSKLKPRERRVVDQVKHFLKQNFGVPYDENFYAGDWLLGPNYFCWQPICSLGYDVNSIGIHLQPKNLSDFELVLKRIRGHKDTVENYIKNLKLGVNAGYVREKIDCIAGRNALVESHKTIGATRKPESVLKEWYTKYFLHSSFLKGLDQSANVTWMANHGGKSLKSSLVSALVEGVGQPVLDLINYLEFNHSRHCLPKGVSSGLGNLPVDYVYVDGIPDKSRKTTKVLPITGTKLSGKETYKKILPYFTTTDITPEEIFKKGQEQLNLLYPKALQLVKNVTGEKSESEAIKKFRALLKTQSQWHGLMKFPENESNDKAHKTCIDHESAKKYCPVRWESIQIWADYIRQVMALIYPKITDSFYFTGKKNTVPNCPVMMWPHYNPSNGAMFFQKSDAECKSPTLFGLPFFLERYGPKYHEWSVTGHEARPGHHTQFQGTEEHFRDQCGGIVHWVDKKGYYVNFIEGWGLYSENPILSDDTDLYKENMLQKLGMIKWQIFRAVRLIVDTGLHYRGENRCDGVNCIDETQLTMERTGRRDGLLLDGKFLAKIRDEDEDKCHNSPSGSCLNEYLNKQVFPLSLLSSTWALDQFDKYTWDTTDFVVKEITRYMSDPGQATAYMLGRLDILGMRNKAKKELGDRFSIKDFHYQILSQGYSPMDYIKSYIDHWISCVKDSSGSMCEYVLTPVRTLIKKKTSKAVHAIPPPRPARLSYV